MDACLHEGIDFILKNALAKLQEYQIYFFFINIMKNVGHNFFQPTGYAKLFYFVKIIHGKPDCV